MRELIKENAELAIGVAVVGALIPIFWIMMQPDGIIYNAIEAFAESIC